jgi:hypothetical protein
LFAGEATIARGSSFANGAYLSGEREANRICESLKGKPFQSWDYYLPPGSNEIKSRL